METKHQSGSYCLGPAGTQTNIVRPIWSQEESKSEVPLSYLYWDIRINRWITHLWSVKNIVILAATCSTLDKNLKLQHIWNNLLHPKLINKYVTGFCWISSWNRWSYRSRRGLQCLRAVWNVCCSKRPLKAAMLLLKSLWS